MRAVHAVMAIGLLAAAACGRAGNGDDMATDTDPRPGATAPTDGGMEGMAGMQAMPMARGTTMDQMQAQMAALESARGDTLIGMMPMHRQMLANMIAQFNREMAEMNMAADAQWQATVDSLRQDLVRMPELSATELQRMMPAHQARIVRLMDMHRSMMADHGM